MANILQNGFRNIMSMLPDEARDKAKKILEERILSGGELVSNEQFDARVNFCKTRLSGQPCEYFGPVFPGGIEFIEGCQACNCPMITKAHMKSITDPIMAQMFQGGSTEIKCKHPEGNFWEQIDAKF